MVGGGCVRCRPDVIIIIFLIENHYGSTSHTAGFGQFSHNRVYSLVERLGTTRPREDHRPPHPANIPANMPAGSGWLVEIQDIGLRKTHFFAS